MLVYVVYACVCFGMSVYVCVCFRFLVFACVCLGMVAYVVYFFCGWLSLCMFAFDGCACLCMPVYAC